ncbi:pantoate--beta-alanine ligase [Candidatus Poribacteria bacterium]
MKLITSPSQIQSYCRLARAEGKTIGLVPTMGFLHEGHLSLMRPARVENDLLVVSIFVNPTQFCPNEDYEAYPRDLQRDSEMAAEVGVDVIFSPTAKDMYPNGYATFVNVERVTEKLCGAARPGHFRGVTTVVAKLFNLTQPHRAYFGQKDAQQTVVIRRMVEDLNFGVEIVVLPTVREDDGIAMSSRNKYLKEDERQAALVLIRSLRMTEELIRSGQRDAAEINRRIRDMIEAEPLARIDYIALVNADTLADLDTVKGKTLIALAVFIGKTRLIDNVVLDGDR